MGKVSWVLQVRQHEPQSRTQIEQGVPGEAEYVRIAIDRLIAEGYATELERPRRARLVRLERPFDFSDEGGSV
jgi:hypothetical protein